MKAFYKYYKRKAKDRTSDEYFAVLNDDGYKNGVWVGYYFCGSIIHSMFGFTDTEKEEYEEIEHEEFMQAMRACFKLVSSIILCRNVILRQDYNGGRDRIEIAADEDRVIEAIKFVTHWRTKNETILGRFNSLGSEERDKYIEKLAKVLPSKFI